MKPIIGITGDIEEDGGRRYLYIDLRYGKLVEEAGGIPLLLHPTESVKEIISKMDGLLLSGGEDIHPRFYGEEPLYPMDLSPDLRTDFEISLLKEAIKGRVPILGICHGMQLINVALGGTLYQDIKRQLPGFADHRLGSGRHEIKLSEGSKLFEAIGKKEISVTSTHHQAVRDLGKGLQICARAEDGIVEAFEMPGHPFLIGAQWHPEKGHDEGTRRFFEGFLRSCAKI